MAPESKTVLGSYSTTERRLCFQAASFYAMESLFIVMVLIAINLSLLHRKSFVSRDIGSLAGISTILARSHDAMKSVSGTGHASMLRLKNYLSDYAYATSGIYNSHPPTFQISVAPGSATRGSSTASNAVTTTQMRWWRPFALAFWGRLLTFSAPVALIVTLQTLLHKSQFSNRRWHCHRARYAIHTLRVDSTTSCCIPWYRDPLLHVSNRL
jgi:serine/threonine protein kinase